MIELKSVSALPLVGLGGGRLEVSRKNKEMIKHLNLTDYDKLKRVYYRFKKEDLKEFFSFTDGLEHKITVAEAEIEESNKEGLEPKLFDVLGPKLYRVGFDEQEQDLIDKNTYACDLLYGSPFEYGENHGYERRNLKLYPYSVYEIKHMLTHCDVKGRNMLKKYLKIIDDKEVEKILKALYLYQEQLEKQYDEWDYQLLEEKDLFYSHQGLKEELIKPQIKEVADYLVDEAKEFVWADDSITEQEKSKIYKCAYKTDIGNLHKQKRFIEMLSHYTTVEEAEKGLVKTKSLDKLIIK